MNEYTCDRCGDPADRLFRSETLCNACIRAVAIDRLTIECKAIVSVGSHRARAKLSQLLGDSTGFYSFRRNGEWREVPINRLDDALKIKGIKKSRWSDDLREFVLRGAK